MICFRITFNSRKKLSSKRCGTCDGCTADFCGTCLFCTNPRSLPKCVKRTWTSEEVRQGHQHHVQDQPTCQGLTGGHWGGTGWVSQSGRPCAVFAMFASLFASYDFSQFTAQFVSNYFIRFSAWINSPNSDLFTAQFNYLPTSGFTAQFGCDLQAEAVIRLHEYKATVNEEHCQENLNIVQKRCPELKPNC